VEPFLYIVPAGACESARAWASQALDGELGVLERAALEAHLVDCADCDAFVRSIGAVTLALRSAPLAEPERTWQAVPARSLHRSRVVIGVAAATAVAASIAFGSLVGSFTRNGSTPTRSAAAPGGFIATQQPYREQALLALLPRLHQRASRVVAV
jgi:anti-sigma factor RsiW